VLYNIPENKEMHIKICKTIEHDVTVQWLASTPLKRDQFKFLYDIQEIIYKCALRSEFLKLDFSQPAKLEESAIFSKVIP
jgi:hypothetical protein